MKLNSLIIDNSIWTKSNVKLMRIELAVLLVISVTHCWNPADHLCAKGVAKRHVINEIFLVGLLLIKTEMERISIWRKKHLI